VHVVGNTPVNSQHVATFTHVGSQLVEFAKNLMKKRVGEYVTNANDKSI